MSPSRHPCRRELTNLREWDQRSNLREQASATVGRYLARVYIGDRSELYKDSRLLFGDNLYRRVHDYVGLPIEVIEFLSKIYGLVLVSKGDIQHRPGSNRFTEDDQKN